MTNQPLTELQEFAHRVHAAGKVIIPVAEDGSKQPVGAWGHWAEVAPTDAQHNEWFGPDSNRTGAGIVTGAGDLPSIQVIECDEDAVSQVFLDTAEATDLDFVQDMVAGWSDKTPGGGLHIYFRCEDMGKNSKLAMRPLGDRRFKSLIETKEEMGFCIVGGSFGGVHPSGRAYGPVTGGPETIVTISPEQKMAMFQLAQSLDEREPDAGQRVSYDRTSTSGDRPGDDYNARASLETIRELLPDWKFLFERGRVAYFRRPGKSQGISATYNWDGRGHFKCFTSSTILEPRMYDPFGLYAAVHHKGSLNEAGKALHREGFGKRAQSSGNSSNSNEPQSEDPPGESETDHTIDLGNNVFLIDGAFIECKTVNGIQITLSLTNADIWIEEERIVDNGAERRREIKLAACLKTGEVLSAVVIPAKEFPGMLWPYDAFGTRLWIAPGTSSNGKVRSAIQRRSQIKGYDTTTIRAYTGWEVIDGDHVFLHAGGAIDSKGTRTNITTELAGTLSHVKLPEPSSGETLTADLESTIKVLEVAPLRIAAPLVAAVPAAILGPMVKVDFSMNLHGLTGARKTELAALIQGFFGAEFNGRNFGLSATSTPFALEV
ncbi:MAG: hypothetical protein WKF81_11645, partial [Thermomicrobiales bacterium]